MTGKRFGARRIAGKVGRLRVRPRLEFLETRELLATFTVTNTADRNPDGSTVAGSLRDAIQRANSIGGADIIAFNIPGTAVKTITPGTSGFPSIIDQVTIDGTTQPGFAGQPLIELNGSLAGVGINGLRIVAGGSTVRSLAINRFSGAGILVEGSSTSIERNFLGVTPTGTQASPNGGAGIAISGGTNNRIGGFSSLVGSLGNVLAGNSGAGLSIVNSGNNLIQGNFIGTDSSGVKGVNNSGDGIFINNGSFNQIGGVTTGSGNVISGNDNNGITILNSSGITIRGNFIGVDGLPTGGPGGTPTGGSVVLANGRAGISIGSGSGGVVVGGLDPEDRNIISGNSGAGIEISDGPGTRVLGNIIGGDNTATRDLGNGGAGIAIASGDASEIGGTLAGAANVIVFNGKSSGAGGVNLAAGRRIPILSNSIYNNNGLGIVLQSGSSGPNENDGNDGDSGPNDLQNYPELSQVGTAAGRTLVQGVLPSKANSIYTVQVFVSPTRDASGHGEGATLLGQFQVTTDVNGLAPFNVTLPTPSVIGQFVSATATDLQGNTSEFSVSLGVVAANQANLSVQIDATPNPATLGSDLVYNVTVTNSGPDPATNVRFVQNLPSGVTYQSSTSQDIQPNGNTLAGNLGVIPAGTSLTFSVTVTPTVIGKLTTSANVSSGEIDSDTSDNTATQITEINIPADLGLDMSSDPGVVTVGKPVTIVASVTNYGPGSASGTKFTLTLPAGVSFVSALSGQGTTSITNGVVTANLGSLQTGKTVGVQVIVVAPIDVPALGSLPFIGSVDANEIEPSGVDPHPNDVAISVPVAASSDVSVTLTATPEPILAGANLTYTYVVRNNGPSPATGVVLTDVIPAGFQFVLAPNPSIGTASFASGKVTVTIGDLPKDGVSTGTIILRPTDPGQITNVVNVTRDQSDPDPSNDRAQFISTISPSDLAVFVQATPSPVEVGSNLTYTINVINRGPATASGVKLANTLPSDVTYVSSTTGQGTIDVSNGVVNVDLGDMLVGASVPITIVVTPTKSGTLTNLAAVSFNGLDVFGEDNSATTTTLVSPADLSVQFSANTSVVLASDPITFTAVVRNDGPFAATNVALSNVLVTGLTLLSATSTQGTVSTVGNSVTGLLGSLLPGGTATVTITAVAAASGTYTNTVTVRGDQVDPDLSLNTASAIVTVTNAAGTLQFPQATFTAAENSGLAQITITRLAGNLGAVTVAFKTADGTAVAGTNYTETTGTITFLDGETTKTVSIPVKADGLVLGNKTVQLLLSDPTGGASLGATSVATLVITESDQDVKGPLVTDVRTEGAGRSVNGVTLVFDEALDPARATNAANYSIFAPGRNGQSQLIGLLTPVYDSVARTVRLTTTKPLGLNTFYRVVVGAGVTDVFGNSVRGNAVTNGAEYQATFARGSSLKYVDRDGDTVTLGMSNGGLLDLYRASNGEGQVLRVLGAGSRRSVLTGNVRRGSFGSDGVTSFQSIIGANFGRVDSRLTTPKFFVDDVTAFIRGSGSSTLSTASVALVSTASKSSPKLFTRRFVGKFTR